MAAVVTFSDGSFLEFAKGNFDYWCIYLTRPGQTRYAPRDEIYFYDLLQFSNKHGARSIYDDFISIYDKAQLDLDKTVFDHIHSISQKYGEDALEIEIIYAILYMGMVAENNKKNTILKKRVKRLGVHQVLIDGYAPKTAANYSRGKKWRDLDSDCRARGF